MNPETTDGLKASAYFRPSLGKTIEEFIDDLDKKFSEIIGEISDDKDYRLPAPLILELANKLETARLEAVDSCFDIGTDATFTWITNEPSFQLALRNVGFTARDDKNPYVEIICQENVETAWRAYNLRKATIHYATLHISYVGGLANACYGFLSGKRRKAALEGPKALHRMINLMTEIERIRDTTDFLGHPISIGGRFWEKQKSDMEGTLEHLFSTTKRDDKDLASRLMASEIIRLHMKLFYAPHKSAVFHLMGLPFIQRPIEMKTIERLVALERARAENLSTSKLSVLSRKIIC
ncbi:hypothetical protein LCG56_22300 [Pseudomonas cannabina pv. alisalensis]|uniref:hypothetical protein n=1 Tax=Pseudomonas syringae group TaxID=136849 RepID=UPI001331953C|nr:MULTISPECIES: hypothetical protein [Pseudomonas syringae group]UBY96666.1 hypothetical protein LCG56_22300 [Pseudomonas cannabina pv. alisalensis]